MQFFFILLIIIIITVRVKKERKYEETRYEHLLQDSLKIEKNYSKSIARRIFDYVSPPTFYVDPLLPAEGYSKVTHEMIQQFVEIKKYHESGSVMSFDKFYKEKIKYQLFVIESIMNRGALAEAWRKSEQTESFNEYYKKRIEEQKKYLYSSEHKNDLKYLWEQYKEESDKSDLREEEVRKYQESITLTPSGWAYYIWKAEGAFRRCRLSIGNYAVMNFTILTWTKMLFIEFNGYNKRIQQKITNKNLIYLRWAYAKLTWEEYRDEMKGTYESWYDGHHEPNFASFFRKKYNITNDNERKDEKFLFQKWHWRVFQYYKYWHDITPYYELEFKPCWSRHSR